MIIKVGMGEGIVHEPPHIITCEGLGSCVAVAIYDFKTRIGGLAHIMLPDSIKTGNGNNNAAPSFQFADTAIPAMLEDMRIKGASVRDAAAKIIGGARMFPSYSGTGNGIGAQNIAMIRQILKKEAILIIGEDTGGSQGRSVEFHLDTGRVVVKRLREMDREI